MKLVLLVCLVSACGKSSGTTTTPSNASGAAGSAASIEPKACSQEQVDQLQCEESVGPDAKCYFVEPGSADEAQLTATLRGRSGCSPNNTLAGAWCCNPH